MVAKEKQVRQCWKKLLKCVTHPSACWPIDPTLRRWELDPTEGVRAMLQFSNTRRTNAVEAALETKNSHEAPDYQ